MGPTPSLENSTFFNTSLSYLQPLLLFCFQSVMSSLQPKFSLSQPRFDQTTYWGRAQHFFVTTNPLNILATQQQLQEARELLDNYKKGEAANVSCEELWAAKELYDSAYHPDTGIPGYSHTSQSYPRRDDVPAWEDVCPGPLQHGDHWLHDDILQNNTRGCVLAVVQPEF